MPTRNVVLTDHHEKVIESLVGSGRYQNASEVLREGLRLLEQREAAEASKLELLRDALRVGMADVDAGRFRSFRSAAEMAEYLNGIAEGTIGHATA
jgi:antitoxin ParD1/3/4